MASRKGWDSMSPTVPPISDDGHIRVFLRPGRRYRLLISLVMWGMICTVAAQVVSPPLPVQNGPVHLARGDGGVDGQVLIDKPLIVAQVQVRLRPVVGDKYLPVLVGAHGAGVHIEIRVQLLHCAPADPAASAAGPGTLRRSPLPRPDTTPPVTKMYFVPVAMLIPPLRQARPPCARTPLSGPVYSI